MIRAGFGYRGHINNAFPEGRMNATDYQDLLDIQLSPFGEAIGGPFWIFHSCCKLNMAMVFALRTILSGPIRST